QELAGDNQFLDFRGPFINSQRANVAIQTLNHASPDPARAPMNLPRAVNTAAGCFSSKNLCFARFARHTAAVCVFEVSSTVNKKTSGIEFSGHVGQLFLNQLVRGEQNTKPPSNRRITQCFIESAPSPPAGGCTHARSEHI